MLSLIHANDLINAFCSPGRFRMSIVVGAIVFLSGCAGWSAHREGNERLAKGDLEGGLSKLAQASKEAPENVAYRQSLASRRESAINELLAQAQANLEAGNHDMAAATYERIGRIDTNNSRAANGLERVAIARRHTQWLVAAQEKFQSGDLAGPQDQLAAILRENPGDRRAGSLQRVWAAQARERSGIDSTSPRLKAAYRRPVSLNFRDATLLQVFESLKLASGINFMFDRDVRTDARQTLGVSNKTLEDVIRVILAGQRLASRVIDEDTLLIYPNTPEKARDYQEMVIRTFYLGNADATKVLNLARTLVKARDTYVDERLNVLVIRDTVEVVRLAEKVIGNLDLAEPEVMLELEVLEVSVNKLRELGLRFPDSIAGSVRGAAGAGQLTLPEFRNRNSSMVNLTFNDPLMVLNLKQSVGDASLLANPRIRIKNKQVAKVLVGERVPVITTTATANVGTSESVSYLDVGLKLELEPSVSLDDDVSMKVALEVSNIVGTITRSSGLQAFRLGTRNTATTLRVRDGETQVLAGLIQMEDRRAASSVPGLGDLPVLGRLFSNTLDTDTRTEIVLLITPRVVRNIALPSPDRLEILSGTESAQGATPIQLRAPLPGVQAPGPGGAIPVQNVRPDQTTTPRATPAPAQDGVVPGAPAFAAPPLIPSSPGSAPASQPGR